MLKWIKQQLKELVDAYVEGRDEMQKKVAGKDYKPSKKRKKQVDIQVIYVKLFIQLENNIAQESQNANTKERFQNY